MHLAFHISPIKSEVIRLHYPDKTPCESCCALLDEDPLHLAVLDGSGHIIPGRIGYNEFREPCIIFHRDWSLCGKFLSGESISQLWSAPRSGPFMYSCNLLKPTQFPELISKILDSHPELENRNLTYSILPPERIVDFITAELVDVIDTK
jgi:hypothetical protein